MKNRDFAARMMEGRISKAKNRHGNYILVLCNSPVDAYGLRSSLHHSLREKGPADAKALAGQDCSLRKSQLPQCENYF